MKNLTAIESNKRHKNNLLKMEYQRLQGDVCYVYIYIYIYIGCIGTLTREFLQCECASYRVLSLSTTIHSACRTTNYPNAHIRGHHASDHMNLALPARLQKLSTPFGVGVTVDCGKTVLGIGVWCGTRMCISGSYFT